MQNFQDKDMITDILMSQKHITQVYNIFSSECSTQNIKSIFMKILNEEHDIQMNVFDEMKKRGWYNPTQAKSDKIDSAKTKFENIKKNI